MEASAIGSQAELGNFNMWPLYATSFMRQPQGANFENSGTLMP
jgi:hypothetical protein